LAENVIKLFIMGACGENSFRGEEFSFVSGLQKSHDHPENIFDLTIFTI
jgi:hypothetical protein